MPTRAQFELPTWSALPARPDPDFDRLARVLADRLAVPRALVVLVSKGGQVIPGATGLGEPWNTRRSMPLSHSLSQEVVVSGDVLVIPDTRRDPAVSDSPAVRELGVGAYAGAPLVDVQGRPMGVLVAIDDRPRDWAAGDVRELVALADECSCLLQAQALELAEREARAAAEREEAAARKAATAAQLAVEEAEAEADRARVVARLSSGLLSVRTLADVLRTVDRLVRSPLGAAAAVLAVTDAGSTVVRAWNTSSYPWYPEPSATLTLDDDHPLCTAVRERRLVTVATLEEGEALFPDARGVPDAGHETALAVPVLLGQHASSGSLMVTWAGRRELDPAVRTVLPDLARHVGHALDRVLLSAARRRLAPSGSVVPGR
ncbi:GAF domain-containing protein [Modestobacter sp. URMC 112]